MKHPHDPLYCEPCGWLFHLAADAIEHRRQAHPELEARAQAEAEARRIQKSQAKTEEPPVESGAPRITRVGDRFYL